MDAQTTQPQQNEPRARAARLLFALALIFAVTALALFLVNRHTPVPAAHASAGGPRDTGLSWAFALLVYLGGPLLPATFGIFIVRRHPRHRLAWLLLATGALIGLNGCFEELAVFAHYTLEETPPGSTLFALLAHTFWIPSYGLMLLTLALFPDGDFLSRRWRWLIGTSLALFLLLFLSSFLLQDPMSAGYQLPNPLLKILPLDPGLASRLSERLFLLAVPFLPGTVLLVFASILVRYRRSTGVERQQMKWLVFFMGLTAAELIGGAALAETESYKLLGEVIMAAPPVVYVGLGLAILHYRLYDIDVIINRALVYGLLSATLLLAYFGSVVLIQRLVAPLVGRQSDVAIVLSTLIIAFLFSPLRRRIQAAIDRRFYRRRYNARRTLNHFARLLHDEQSGDLDYLDAQLLHVVQETMQPEHLSLWLRPPAEK